MSHLTLVETPRDAFQGLPLFIPTTEKILYIRSLLSAGFRHLDFGSFVSPKAVPQMADSLQVWEAIRRPDAYFIAIVANERGLDRAIEASGIAAVGFPFSLANAFQKNNTNRSIAETWPIVGRMVRRCRPSGIDLILYLSMAFGNPDGEPWSLQLLLAFIERLGDLGIQTVSLADTTGVADPKQVREVFEAASSRFKELEFGAHFHSRLDRWDENIRAAYAAGCRRFDSATAGLGGCPFAQDQLVGNIPTELLVEWLERCGEKTGIDRKQLRTCAQKAQELQLRYGGVPQ